MGKRYLIFGRAADCDVVIDLPDVSAHHLRLVDDQGTLLIEDLGSANGTYVDGKKIEQASLRPGSDVRLGTVLLPWHHEVVRAFIQARQRRDTLFAFSDEAANFMCVSCGTRGQVPPGFTRGYLICGACSTRLYVTSGDDRSRKRTWLLVAATLLLAGALLAVFAVRQNDQPDGSWLVSSEPSHVRSPAEAAIVKHTLKKVLTALDVNHPKTRNAAVKFAALEDGPFRVEQAARIWSEVRSRWRYVSDPNGGEYFARASETIDNGYAGDCDDFATVLAAMLHAIGGKSRIVMMDGEHGGHAYAEVCVDASSPEDARNRLITYYETHHFEGLGEQHIERIHYRPSVDAECKLWLNLDWNAGVPGGPYEHETWAVGIFPDGSTRTLSVRGKDSKN